MAKRRQNRQTVASEPAPLKYPATGKLKDDYERVLRLATALPGVEASRSYGTPAIKVAGKLLARLRTEAEGGLAIRCEMIDRNMLVQAAPETFYYTEHYANHPMVLINLATVRWDAMPQIIEQAWRMVAPAKLIAAFEGRPGLDSRRT